MSRRPEIIAHRGVPHEHAENSLAGFLAAIALGADAIELDVQVTADGHPVVHHDPRLGRPAVPNARLAGREIAALTLAELRAHELTPGIGVPTLDEVLETVAGRATVYVEVKAREAADAVAALLRGREAWTSVHAFDHRVPARVSRLLPSLHTGVLSSSYLTDNVAPMRLAGARDLWQHRDMIDVDLVSAVHKVGGRVVAWTVNEPADMTRLAALGIDAICTDVPAAALQRLSGT